jgi:hypothetical protein
MTVQRAFEMVGEYAANDKADTTSESLDGAICIVLNALDIRFRGFESALGTFAPKTLEVAREFSKDTE